MITISGVVVGLVISIILVFRRWHGAYALIAGALSGAFFGGANLEGASIAMIEGIQRMAPAIIRVMTAGVLVGTLVGTGAAVRIADTIIEKLGEKHIYAALAGSAAFLTGIGIFMDVSCITLAPIALSAAKRIKISKTSVLVALAGGCKVGNFISPNPPTIAVSGAFGVSIPEIMGFNLVPGLFSLLLTIFLARLCSKKGPLVTEAPEIQDKTKLPSFIASILGPIAAILLLLPTPIISSTAMDPLVALPLGGFIGLLAMGKLGDAARCTRLGLEKITGVVLLLLGIGALAGVINASDVKTFGLELVTKFNVPAVLLAPVSGVIFSAATGSATAGAIVSCVTFANFLLRQNVIPVIGASLVSAGSMGLEHVPHGSFFHTSKDSLHLSLKERFMAYHWETLIGLSIPIFTGLYSALISYLRLRP